MAPKAKPKTKAEAKAVAKAKAEPKPKAEAKPDEEPKAEAAAKAKASPEPKASAKEKAVPGEPAAGSGVAAVRQKAADATSKAGAKAGAKPGAKAGAKAVAKADSKASESPPEDDVPKVEKESKEAAEASNSVEDAANANEEEHKRLEELQKQELQRKAEEEAKRKEKENGEVVLKYSMYNEKFPIKDGSITAAQIDEVYCLSDVMPGCEIHLSDKSEVEKYTIESAGEVFPYIYEHPPGTFHGLEAESTYYVYVTEDEAEFLKSQEKAKAAFAGVKSDKVRGEGCSCLEGNPCADEYVCTDWHNRFALARKNGWIGYQAM